MVRRRNFTNSPFLTGIAGFFWRCDDENTLNTVAPQTLAHLLTRNRFLTIQLSMQKMKAKYGGELSFSFRISMTSQIDKRNYNMNKNFLKRTGIMLPNSIPVLVGVFCVIAGCTLNVEESARQVSAQIPTNDVSRVKIQTSSDNFLDPSIIVTGSTDSLIVASTTLYQLNLIDQENDLDKASLMVSVSAGTAQPSISYSGKRWESISLEDMNVTMLNTLPLEVNASNDKVRVTNMQAYVDVEADNGEVTVSTIDSCRISASNGAVTATVTAGPAYIDADNGEITLRTAQGGRVNADNGSIDITITDTTLFTGIDVHADNGEITIHVPTQLNANLDISCENGDIHYPSSVTNHSRINQGGTATITIRANNGDITLKLY